MADYGLELTGYEDPTDPFGLEEGPGSVCDEDFVRLLGVTEFEVTHISVQISGFRTVHFPVS